MLVVRLDGLLSASRLLVVGLWDHPDARALLWIPVHGVRRL